MSSPRVPSQWNKSFRRPFPVSSICNRCVAAARQLNSSATASNATDPSDDVVQSPGLDSQSHSTATTSSFDPLAASRARKGQLPPSRYQFRPPKYDRGPLHPHQPPAPSDLASRAFVPGPFSSACLEQTYHNSIAPDILTMCYQHLPPGYKPPPKAPRLRKWVGDSPYYANRKVRKPRGGDVLRLLRQPIMFENVPRLQGVVVHTYVNQVIKQGSSPLHVAGMVLQAMTNVRVETKQSRVAVAEWGLLPGTKSVAATATLKGEDMYHFLTKLIRVVLPRIKDWKGVAATSGDGSGNLSFGLTPNAVGLFPEVEINYDSYPQKMIPGCHITIQTTAKTDKDARLLLQTIGIPFHGKAKR